MSKRFTDTKKWRNEWFRTLPLKAKLAWIFLCDECDSSGIWKSDYGLAAFQLDFAFNQTVLKEWFGDKVYLFGEDSVLVVQFFEFQYGESKDTWSAKVRAAESLSRQGFHVENNKVILPQYPHSTPTVVPQYPHSGGTRLIRVRVRGIVRGKGKKGDFDFENVYQSFPLKKGKGRGIEICHKEIKTQQDFEDLTKAVDSYAKDCAMNKTEPRFIKHFSTFMSSWRDWAQEGAGSVISFVDKSSNEYNRIVPD